MLHNIYRTVLAFICLLFFFEVTQAQVETIYDVPEISSELNTIIQPKQINFCTTIKNQGNTSTCWSFSTLALIESETARKKMGVMDLSEMFVVRNIYKEKARNYILRQGKAAFAQGALGHDLLHAIEQYGAMPESAYSGLVKGSQRHDHDSLFQSLQIYLDSVLKKKNRSLEMDWMPGFNDILNRFLGNVPDKFTHSGKLYTPEKFARDVLKFKLSDYVQITSFTHIPYYVPHIIEVPDNFSNGAYWNVPIDEMMIAIDSAIQKGYTALWDADVSNPGFSAKAGIAIHVARKFSGLPTWDTPEENWNAMFRQQSFERLETQDDHLMQIVGIDQSVSNKKPFYRVKNSWGNQGPANGFLWASKAYVAMNTISIILPSAALSADWMKRCKLK